MVIRSPSVREWDDANKLFDILLKAYGCAQSYSISLYSNNSSSDGS